MIQRMANKGSRGAVLVEAAFILPLALVIIFSVCELFFTATRYFAARDGFSQAERRISLPLTVLTADTFLDKVPCSELATQMIKDRSNILGAGLGDQDLKVGVERSDANHLRVNASVQNRCVICGAMGVYFPVAFDFESEVFSVNGAFSCIPDGES